MGIFFKNEQYDFQALRGISLTSSGQADICEVLSTCERIKNGKCDSWLSEWTKTADAFRKFGEESLKLNCHESASHSFLRASNYYRIAEFYLNYGCDMELMKKIDKSCTECFNFGIQYSKYDIKPVNIPFERTSLPAHFYKYDSKQNVPTIIALSGNDGTKEELYAIGVCAIERGMNCLILDGPGQGEAIRQRGIPFRYNTETVMAAAIDYLLLHTNVDPGKIIVWGESLGGYFAARAAAFEHRIALCIANGGINDCIAYGKMSGMSIERRNSLFHLLRKNSKRFNRIIKFFMKRSVNMDWIIRHGLFTFQVKTPTEYILSYEPYLLTEGIASKITCPTLITDCENEVNFRKQPEIVYNMLKCPKEYMLFTHEECGGYHCEAGGRLYANDRIFNWIEKTLNDVSN